jgi:hypothetical protein
VIARTFDANRINVLVNHPTIRPFVGGDGKSILDLTNAVMDRKNIFLLGEHGGFAFTWCAPRTFEIHTFILPEGRGALASKLAIEARSLMQELGARHLWTRVAESMAHVLKFTLNAGFEIDGKQTIDAVTYDLLSWRC